MKVSGWLRRVWLSRWWLPLWLLLGMSRADAHLMLAQQGTLNLAGDGAYLMWSLPVSAFSDVDDNADGRLSSSEFQQHLHALHQQVLQGIQLRSGTTVLPLQGVMLSLSPPDSAPQGPADQLIMMGRFALDAPAQADVSRLQLTVTLFGKQPTEQFLDLTITRNLDRQHAVWLRMSMEQTTQQVWPTLWQRSVQYLHYGAIHVLTGWDHLAFLLLILWRIANWRVVLTTLSCFTVGHAATLTASVYGLVVLPSWLVEPAIAGTVCGLAIYEWRLYRRISSLGSCASFSTVVMPWRYGIVTACALIHGLGLSTALRDQQLAGNAKWQALLAFNVGVELAQLLVAMIVLCGFAGWRRSVVLSPQKFVNA